MILTARIDLKPGQDEETVHGFRGWLRKELQTRSGIKTRYTEGKDLLLLELPVDPLQLAEALEQVPKHLRAVVSVIRVFQDADAAMEAA
jgi:hypothetical protein